VETEPGLEVLARGPIHEGFAQPSQSRLRPGPLVPRQPPKPIPEIPPDKKPEGKNVKWLPGYWAWDPERKDFLWVSGTWRVAPRGRRWVPGYWTQADNGWRWVHGLWVAAKRPSLDYLAPPPKPVDNGPTSNPLGENSFWVPGCWVPRGGEYLWRPGYWNTYRPGRVWVPDGYAWTPGGCLYNSGYWDYPLEDRGLLFAPVYFTQPLWLTPGWCYRPYWYVGYGPVLSALWFWPAWNWYFFGDWYGRRYWGWGFLPWYAWGARRWDPLFGYYRWATRANPNWQTGLRSTFLVRWSGTAALPPRTLAAQNSQLRGGNGNSAAPFLQGLNQPPANVRLASLSASQVIQQRNAARQAGKISQARNRQEWATARRMGMGSPSGSARTLGSYRLPGNRAATRTGNLNRPGFSSPQGWPANRSPYSALPYRTGLSGSGFPPAYYRSPGYRSMPSYRGGGGYYRGGGGFGGGRSGGGRGGRR
jgi:hypothetical protein